jgi:ADP-heptose:LPS heptosyltransferase
MRFIDKARQYWCWITGKIPGDIDNMLLLRAMHGFGDHLMASAVVNGIHHEHPDWKIGILAKHPEIFLNNPMVACCWDITNVPKIHPIYKRAIQLDYDKFVPTLANNSTSKHLIDYLYDRLPFQLSNRLYIPKIFLNEQEQTYRHEEIARLGRPLIAVSPYGKKTSPWPGKIYPKDKWAKLCNLLSKAGMKLIQIGATEDGDLLPHTADWRDLGYRLTAAVIRQCDAVITHVGGIMHLATACQTPCVVLYGGTEDPKVSGYPKNLNLPSSIDCAPCWRQDSCDSLRCWEMLTPDFVVEQTITFVNQQASQK